MRHQIPSFHCCEHEDAVDSAIESLVERVGKKIVSTHYDSSGWNGNRGECDELGIPKIHLYNPARQEVVSL